MKKIFVIIILILLFIIIAYLVNNINNYKEKIEQLEKQTAGMSVTIFGGSNMQDKGNINSCGYMVRTANENLILVDGGRDLDAPLVLDYIKRFGKGKIDYWFITHAHEDHVGALLELLEKEDIAIENICYSLNPLEWYKENDKRGFETEEKMIKELSNKKIKNRIQCKVGQDIQIDNIKCDILRIANPEAISGDSGNDSSMIFKMIATDVDKSIIFLGDAYTYTSSELMKNPEKLKSDAVQMAHHGSYGVTKEVYEAINPELCFFNAPDWLYNNDNGNGYNSGTWQSVIVREWMSELETENIVAFNGDRTVRFTYKGIEY